MLPSMASPPKDRFKLVHILAFFIGLGTLYPWNSCVTAIKYFFYKLGNQSLSDLQRADPRYFTDVQKNFPAYLSVCSMVPLAIFNVITLFLIKRFSLFNLAGVAGFGIFLMMLIVTIMVPIQMNAITFLGVTLLIMIKLNVCGAILQASVFGTIAILPSRIMGLVVEGQAVAGVLTALTRLITIASTDDPTVEGVLFFIISLIVLAIMLVGIILLPKLPYFKYYWNKQMGSADAKSKEGANSEALSELHLKGVLNSEGANGTLAPVEPKSQFRAVLESLREVLSPGMVLFLAINMTLIVYPTMPSNISPTSGGSEEWRIKYFTQVVVFLSFNVCDYIGRLAAGYIKWPKRDNMKLLLVLCVLRYALIPIFMLMNQQPRNIPVIFEHDAWPIILVIIMGLTNGYAVALGFIYGPSFASPGNAAACGTALTLYLTFGLALGVAIGAGLFQII